MYCSKCGSEISESDKFCPKCGEYNDSYKDKNDDINHTLFTIAKVLAIISCISVGIFLIPLAWMIPMTVKMSKYEKSGEVPPTSFNVCTILFLNTISGILLCFIKK